jgi:hypothetical protein
MQNKYEFKNSWSVYAEHITIYCFRIYFSFLTALKYFRATALFELHVFWHILEQQPFLSTPFFRTYKFRDYDRTTSLYTRPNGISCLRLLLRRFPLSIQPFRRIRQKSVGILIGTQVLIECMAEQFT